HDNLFSEMDEEFISAQYGRLAHISRASFVFTRASPRMTAPSQHEAGTARVGAAPASPRGQGGGDQGAGTSTRSMVWMTPFEAGMLTAHSTSRGFFSSGVSSRSVIPR